MEEKFLQAEEPEAERNSQFQTRRSLSSSSGALSFDQFGLSHLNGRSTFGKEEKLKSKKIIDQLFKEGKSVSANGFTLVYLVNSLTVGYPAQAGFSVPKRHFKCAADRNRIKRLMREVYRNNKLSFYEKLLVSRKQMACMFVYKGKDLPGFEITSKALVSCLNRVILS